MGKFIAADFKKKWNFEGGERRLMTFKGKGKIVSFV